MSVFSTPAIVTFSLPPLLSLSLSDLPSYLHMQCLFSCELVCLCLLSTSVPSDTRVYNVSSPQDSIAVRGFVFGDLLGSTTYIILLSAVNVAGVSPVRESFPFTTLAPVLPTAPVSDLSCSVICFHGLHRSTACP